MNSSKHTSARASDIRCWGAFSDTGPLRTSNEDAWFADEGEGLYLVADGVGSSRGGATAAKIAVEVLPGMVKQRLEGVTRARIAAAGISEALVELGERIHEAGTSRAALTGMCAALVGAKFISDSLIVFHLGDCRAFRFRRGTCEVLTSDHSLLNSLLRRRTETRRDSQTRLLRQTLTRALGESPQRTPEVQITDARAGDRVLLCTDGLAVNRRRAERVLAIPGTSAACARNLLALGRSRDIRDNATGLVVDFRGHLE